MYKQIYIPVDNSDYSNMAIDIGVELARQFGATVVGSHVCGLGFVHGSAGDVGPHALALAGALLDVAVPGS